MTTLAELMQIKPHLEIDVDWEALAINQQHDPDHNNTEGFVTISVSTPLDHATGEYASLMIVRPCTLEVIDGKVTQFMGYPEDFDNVYIVGVEGIEDAPIDYNQMYLHDQYDLLKPHVENLMDLSNSWVRSSQFIKALEAC